MKLAIMQPYFFPYLGYVQLMNAVDVFVFYDDVNFITRGWINRNNILSRTGPQRFTLELKKASLNKKINEIQIGGNRAKLLRSIEMNYRRAPFFSQAMPYVRDCLEYETDHLASLLHHNLEALAGLLGLETRFLVSSQLENSHQDLSGTDRILAICKELATDHYINAEGGKALYANKPFADENIDLSFLHHTPVEYEQFPKMPDFVPNLSVLDALMFVGIDGVKDRLPAYQLIKTT